MDRCTGEDDAAKARARTVFQPSDASFLGKLALKTVQRRLHNQGLFFFFLPGMKHGHHIWVT